jgi:hypothetical protein
MNRNKQGQAMNRASSAAIRSALFFFASSILCAGAQAGTQSPPEDAGEAQAHAVELIELMELDADWANPPEPATESRWQDSLPPAPPVTPREEKILPRSAWFHVTPMKAPDRRCDPGLDALFLSKECGKEPSWLGSPRK